MEKDKWMDTGFIRGVVWAAGFMASAHNEESLAEDIFKESGISNKQAAACACEYDLAMLRRAIPELPKGKETEDDE